MRTVSFFQNSKRKPRLVKKLSKKFYDHRGLTKYLGLAMFIPNLTKAKCADIKRSCRTAPIRIRRLIHEHLAFHKRVGYTAVKLRYRPLCKEYTKMHIGKHRQTPITVKPFGIMSKLVPAKDVSWWETQLDVTSIVR